jgi:hypothetical protein
MLGIGPVCGIWLKYVTTGLASPRGKPSEIADWMCGKRDATVNRQTVFVRTLHQPLLNLDRYRVRIGQTGGGRSTGSRNRNATVFGIDITGCTLKPCINIQDIPLSSAACQIAFLSFTLASMETSGMVHMIRSAKSMHTAPIMKTNLRLDPMDVRMAETVCLKISRLSMDCDGRRSCRCSSPMGTSTTSISRTSTRA